MGLAFPSAPLWTSISSNGDVGIDGMVINAATVLARAEDLINLEALLVHKSRNFEGERMIAENFILLKWLQENCFGTVCLLSDTYFE